MTQRSKRRLCPQGYFLRKLGEILSRGARVEDLEEFALELVVSEMHLRKMTETFSEDAMMEEIKLILQEIDETKKLIYRIYRSRIFEREKSRVTLWR